MVIIVPFWCHTDTARMIDKNYTEKIDQLQTILNIWQQRLLPLKGKITVLWSVALPQVLYVTSILYTPKRVTAELIRYFSTFFGQIKKHMLKRKPLLQL